MLQRYWLLVVKTAFLLSCILVVSAGYANELLIWDNQPAGKWDVAYPVGNGRLGAMPFGMFPTEKILINEETIWARHGKFDMPENSFEYLEQGYPVYSGF